MAGIDNKKLIGLLIISWDGLLLSQEHKKKRKQRQYVLLRIRKRDSKGAYCSIINDLRFDGQKKLQKENQWKTIGSHSYTFILFK